MNRRALIASAAAAALAPGGGKAQPSAPDVAGDIEILRRALALHPGLYRYSTPSQIDDRLAALKADFAAAPTLAARYLSLSRFLATIRCGHTYGNFFNQKAAAARELFDLRTRLPFHFTWLDGAMVVTDDPSGVGAPPGAEVLSLNGRPARDVLPALLPFARADGHNDAKRVSLLGVAGTDRIEFFDVFHGLVAGEPPDGIWRLRLRRATGEATALEVPAFDLAMRQAQMTPQDRTREGPVWDWAQRADGVAVLTMPTWALYDSKWDWRTWLDDRLDSLKGARGLIIDLRRNEGGEDCGDPILARLASGPIARRDAERRVRFRRTPADLDRFLDTWDDSFRTLGAQADPLPDGFYRLEPQGADPILPKGPRLDVRTAVLVGPVNSSATFQFADRARSAGLARLFGQTTGGNRRGINGGCFFFVRLPASGLEFDLPLIGYFPPGLPPDAGLDPDEAVAPTRQDLASGRDPALEAAMRWART